MEKRELLPYGIWTLGVTFNSLESKLKRVFSALFYTPPDVLQELKKLVELSDVGNFEGIGKWAKEWVKFMERSPLDYADCSELYKQTMQEIGTFGGIITQMSLLPPKLEVLDVSKIREGAKGFFNKDEMKYLNENLGEVALNEFDAACRALSYGFPTAAGFYLVRICERSLRELYKKETGKDVERKTWGKVLNELEGYYKTNKTNKKPKVLDLLSYLKDVRNSIAHPDQIFKQKEAEGLLTFTTRVVIEIRLYISQIQ